jgi:hypothetical protein
MILLLVVLFSYFLNILAMYEYYRHFLRYRILHNEKKLSNKVFKITGLYLLKIRRGSNFVSKILLVLINMEIIFIPIIIIFEILKIYNKWLDMRQLVHNIISRYINFLWVIMSLLYIVKIRFSKHKAI